MADARSAADFLPEKIDLASLRAAAANCRGCDLYRNATQTVFGEGLRRARIAFVGEQPGDQEDLAGQPFVGPAGQLLDKALADAGIERTDVYVTNAVKHFKWEPRGKRRIHKKPQEREIRACQPWLNAELELIRPEVVVCLGVTAARAVFGKTVRLKDYSSRFTATPLAAATFVTKHPSALLRLREKEDRQRQYQRLVSELQLIKSRLGQDPKPQAAGSTGNGDAR